MAFVRPTLREIVDRVQQDMVSRLFLSGTVLRRAIVYVLSRVLAGATHMLHGHLDYLSKQLFADTSEDEFLVRQGQLFGINVKPAAFAVGNVTFTGTNGSTVSSGHVLQRADGTEYRTTADATIASGTATAPVIALSAAADGNCDSGTVLAFEAPVAGVNGTATVAVSGLSGGADVEAQEDYRVRVLDRMRAPPHGGNAADYVAWTLEVGGVTRAWAYPNANGAGSVVVRFMRDNDAGSPIPDSGEVAAVQSHIDAVRPVTAALTVVAPIAAPVNYTLHVEPNTVAVQNAVTAELTDLHAREAQPSVTLLLSAIRTAIGNAEGLTDYTLTSPAADVTHTTGQIATLGTVTYV